MAVETLKPESTEVIFRGKKAAAFFEPRFIGIMEQELKSAKFAHFCLYIPYKKEDKEKLEQVTIGHFRKEDEEESVLGISTERPETLKVVLRAVERFFGGDKA